jgi:tetratricopeptide (TPR) repeat protein
MQVLPEIISVLSKEEIRNYKLFVNRTNKESQRKDVLLFDLFKKAIPEVNEDKIHAKLYGADATDKNSFYRLKNRLIEDIGLSLLVLNYNQTALNTVLNNFLLAKFFIQKGKWKVAEHFLHKAEKRAIEMDEPALLEIIYGEFIKISQDVLEINPRDYIAKRKKNREKLNLIQEIDDVLAVVTYDIKSSQTFGFAESEVYDALQQKVDQLSKNKELNNSVQLKFKLYHSVSRILLQKHNYVGLQNYLLKTYNEFTAKKFFNQYNHDSKLQMLTYLCNSMYRNGNISESLNYAQQLNQAMSEYNATLRDKYLFFYYNVLVNNYSKTNVSKAIEILDEAKEENIIKKHPLYIGFVYLNLAVSYFGLNDFKNSSKQITKLYMLDSYTSLDKAFRLKISIFELIVRYELTDFDFILMRIKQVQSDFKSLLIEDAFLREKQLLFFIKAIISNSNIQSKGKVNEDIQHFIKEYKSTSQDDSEIINYGDWLAQKIK